MRPPAPDASRPGGLASRHRTAATACLPPRWPRIPSPDRRHGASRRPPLPPAPWPASRHRTAATACLPPCLRPPATACLPACLPPPDAPASRVPCGGVIECAILSPPCGGSGIVNGRGRWFPSSARVHAAPSELAVSDEFRRPSLRPRRRRDLAAAVGSHRAVRESHRSHVLGRQWGWWRFSAVHAIWRRRELSSPRRALASSRALHSSVGARGEGVRIECRHAPRRRRMPLLDGGRTAHSGTNEGRRWRFRLSSRRAPAWPRRSVRAFNVSATRGTVSVKWCAWQDSNLRPSVP